MKNKSPKENCNYKMKYLPRKNRHSFSKFVGYIPHMPLLDSNILEDQHFFGVNADLLMVGSNGW